MTEHNQPIKILHLEDTSKDIEQVEAVLKESNYKFNILVVDSMTEFKKALKEFLPDLILSHSLPSCNSIKAIDVVRRLGLKIPFVVVARPVTEYHAIEALRQGAHDYVLNDRYNRLPAVIINTLKRCRLEKELNAKQDEIIALENKHTYFLDQLPANIIQMDKDGNILAFNKAWKASSDKKYHIGMNYLDAIEKVCSKHNTDEGNIASALRDIITGKISHFSSVYPCLDGNSKKWFRVIAQKENTNKDDGILMIYYDVSERMIAEEARIAAVEELRKRNAHLEQFAFMVSHDLRAPVANIMGIADALIKPNNIVEDEAILKAHLRTSINKLDDVVRHLNEILQGRQNKEEHEEIVSFTGITEDIRSNINNIIKNEKVEIRYDFSEVDELITMKRHLYSLLFNLISISIKHRHPNEGLIIEISTRKKDNKVSLLFRDNGQGIETDAKDQKEISIQNNPKMNLEHQPFDLHFIKTQVENIGGAISVFSETNKGTEFKIEFYNLLKKRLKHSFN